jgi:hypothetical protein
MEIKQVLQYCYCRKEEKKRDSLYTSVAERDQANGKMELCQRKTTTTTATNSLLSIEMTSSVVTLIPTLAVLNLEVVLFAV